MAIDKSCVSKNLNDYKREKKNDKEERTRKRMSEKRVLVGMQDVEWKSEWRK